MTEILAVFCGILIIGLLVCANVILKLRNERDEARYDLDHEKLASQAFENRITTLRADNIALDAQVKTLTNGFNTVANERDQLRAEIDAKAPVRGEGGKFTRKPKPIT